VVRPPLSFHEPGPICILREPLLAAVRAPPTRPQVRTGLEPVAAEPGSMPDLIQSIELSRSGAAAKPAIEIMSHARPILRGPAQRKRGSVGIALWNGRIRSVNGQLVYGTVPKIAPTPISPSKQESENPKRVNC